MQMAIAFSVLQHLVENVRCKTLFITHYPLLASEMGKVRVVCSERHIIDLRVCLQLADVSNGHMGFIERMREGW